MLLQEREGVLESQLRVYIALTEVPSLVPSTHIGQLITLELRFQEIQLPSSASTSTAHIHVEKHSCI